MNTNVYKLDMKEDQISLGFKLFFDTMNNYKDDKENDKNFGILNKEFIKNYLKRETELENKIVELEDKLKDVNKSINITNKFTDDMCRSLLRKIASKMTIEQSISDLEFDHTYFDHTYPDYLNQISINSVVVSNDELRYLWALAEEELHQLSGYNKGLTEVISSCTNRSAADRVIYDRGWM